MYHRRKCTIPYRHSKFVENIFNELEAAARFFFPTNELWNQVCLIKKSPPSTHHDHTSNMGNATSALPIDQETGDVSLYRYYWKKRKQKQHLSQNDFLELLAIVDLIVEEEMRLSAEAPRHRRRAPRETYQLVLAVGIINVFILQDSDCDLISSPSLGRIH